MVEIGSRLAYDVYTIQLFIFVWIVWQARHQPIRVPTSGDCATFACAMRRPSRRSYGQSTLDEGRAESKIYSMFLCNYACFLRERGRSLKSIDSETLNPALAMGRDGGAIFRI